MCSMKIRHRAYAYVTHQDRVLLFTHPDSPEAGIQVPAGGIKDGEDTALAALREATEETGLTNLRIAGFLGHDTRDMRDCGIDELQYRWFYHIVCDGTPPDKWLHGEFDDADKLLIPFAFFWAPLSEALPDLVANYDDFIPKLCDRMADLGDKLSEVNSTPPKI
jgi:8-oxo-dGTP diphosphatase